jgi:PAS domain S-box-containing protein
VYAAQRNWLIDVAQRATANSTQVRIQDLERWRSDRLEEAKAIQANRAFEALSLAVIEPRPAPATLEAWDQFVNVILSRNSYDGAALIDPLGQIKRSRGNVAPSSRYRPNDLQQAPPGTGAATLTEPHPAESGRNHVLLVVPLAGTGEPAGKARLVLEVDPRRELSPAVRGRGIPSSGTQTLLVRRESDAVVVLDSPESAEAPRVGTRFGLASAAGFVERVVRGVEGPFAGQDSSGHRSVGAIRRVGRTDWWIVTTIPTDSIVAQARGEAWRLGIIVGLGALVATAGLLLAWQRRQAALYRRLYEAEAGRDKLVESFEHLSRFANDIVVLADERDLIIEANDRAADAYGYTREELIGRPVQSLEAPGASPGGTDAASRPEPKGHFTYRSRHVRKDGTVFPVEVRARYFERAGHRFFHCIILDITERVEMESRLHETAERYRMLFEDANDAIVLADAETGEILDVNQKVVFLTGRSVEELRGRHHTVLHPPDRDGSSRMNFRSRAIENQFRTIETEIQHVSGRRTPVEVNASRIELRGRKAVLGLFRDLSERRRAEAELRSS